MCAAAIVKFRIGSYSVIGSTDSILAIIESLKRRITTRKNWRSNMSQFLFHVTLRVPCRNLEVLFSTPPPS